MRKILCNKRGETIVEILVAFLLLVLFVEIFASAIRTANRMMTEANQIRADACHLTESLYPYGAQAAEPTNKTSFSYTFKGVQSFVVSGELGEVEATTPSGAAHSFRKYTTGGSE